MEPKANDLAQRLFFLRVPEGSSIMAGAVKLDPAIPIPVELGEASVSALSSLREEHVLAGIMRALAIDPSREHAAYYRGLVLSARPGIFAELMEAGILKAANGDHDGAEELFMARRGRDPARGEPELNLAILHERRAEALERASRADEAAAYSAKAQAAYEALLARDEDYPDVLFNAAFFLAKRGSRERAAACFRSFLRLSREGRKAEAAREALAGLESSDAKEKGFKAAYGDILGGREEAGLEEARKLAAADPEAWGPRFLEGWALRRLGRWEEGLAALDAAASLGGESAELENERSICLMELGEYAKAERALAEALALDPDNVKYVSNLGVLALRRGRRSEAERYFEAALAMEPGDPLAARLLADMRGDDA